MHPMVVDIYQLQNLFKKYITENYENIETQMIDCMKYVNRPIEKMTTGAYREMAKKLQSCGAKYMKALKKACFLKLAKIVIN